MLFLLRIVTDDENLRTKPDSEYPVSFSINKRAASPDQVETHSPLITLIKDFTAKYCC